MFRRKREAAVVPVRPLVRLTHSQLLTDLGCGSALPQILVHREGETTHLAPHPGTTSTEIPVLGLALDPDCTCIQDLPTIVRDVAAEIAAETDALQQVAERLDQLIEVEEMLQGLTGPPTARELKALGQHYAHLQARIGDGESSGALARLAQSRLEQRRAAARETIRELLRDPATKELIHRVDYHHAQSSDGIRYLPEPAGLPDPIPRFPQPFDGGVTLRAEAYNQALREGGDSILYEGSAEGLHPILVAAVAAHTTAERSGRTVVQGPAAILSLIARSIGAAAQRPLIVLQLDGVSDETIETAMGLWEPGGDGPLSNPEQLVEAARGLTH